MKSSRSVSGSGLIATLALVAGLVVVGFAVVSLMRLGHWPSYGNPDPKDLKLPFLHIAALFSYPIGLLSVIAGLLWLMASPAKWSRANALVLGAAAIVWCCVIPGRLLEWLLD